MTDDDLEARVEELERQNERLEDTVEDLEDRLNDAEARLEAFNYARATILEENEELRDRVAELEQVVDPDPGATEYDQLTKEQKVHRIRKKLAETAFRTNGRAALKYNGVRMLFDGHPSPGHTYDLMKRAAQLDGFAYGPGKDGEKRIRVKLEDVNDDALVRAANNATTGEAV